ncbi:MAG: phosphate ABC transporter permease subunit PstC [Armatimonadetes bacterium]|nr:phosphate ABC transporter permease subunit PstC [Armatimonadota bacterium]
MKFKPGEWIAEKLVYLAGCLLVIIVLAIFFYLGRESSSAFDQRYTYGFRIAVRPLVDQPDPVTGELITDLSTDPNATLLAANPEGVDGVDGKEEGVLALGVADPMAEFPLGIGTPLTADTLYKDDWRSPQRISKTAKFKVHAFAMPGYAENKMRLVWQPDSDFVPSSSPFKFKLRVLSAPPGSLPHNWQIDLSNRTRGSVEIPTYIAKTDSERTKGYTFELVAEPSKTGFMATIGGFLSTDWQPFSQYPRYGFVPLLLGTVLMACIAMLIALPIGLSAAIFLSEIASRRVSEWLKPVIELLASVPTVILGYIGLMIVVPGVQTTLGESLGMASGRSLMTASLLLALLILPTIVSLTEDSLRGVSRHLRESGQALGLTTRETFKNVIFPACKAGVVAAALLAFARAIGETMIVWMLSGGSVNMPKANIAATLGSPTRGIADTIAIETTNVEFGGVHYGHLFLIALVLFALTLAINLIAFHFGRHRWQ